MKTPPFKTVLTEHVHTVIDTKGRKVPAIAVLWMPNAYNTLINNTYKNKTNDTDFCILFATYIQHHIEESTQKLALNEGYSKNDTRVISKNIRHGPAIAEFFSEYEQHGKNELKTMTTTIFDNTRNTDNSGFLTLTFNGGIDKDGLPELDGRTYQYLHVVNGLSPTTPSSGSSLVKSFPQTEFVFLEEDVDRYIQFIKDVAVYYNYLQEFNKEACSAKAVLKSSLNHRLATMKDGENADNNQPSTSKDAGKGKKPVKKRTVKETDDHDIVIQKVDKGKKRKATVSTVIEEKKKNILANLRKDPGDKSVKKKKLDRQDTTDIHIKGRRDGDVYELIVDDNDDEDGSAGTTDGESDAGEESTGEESE